MGRQATVNLAPWERNYFGERLSFLRMLRWNSEGARHTAMFMGVIWFSSTEDVTSLRKQSKVCSTSRFSSDISMMAAWTACNLWSFGTSTQLKETVYCSSASQPLMDERNAIRNCQRSFSWLLKLYPHIAAWRLGKCSGAISQHSLNLNNGLNPYTGRYEGRSPPACWWAEVQVDLWRTASPCQQHRRLSAPHSSHCLENSHSSASELEFETSPLTYERGPPGSRAGVLMLTWQLEVTCHQIVQQVFLLYCYQITIVSVYSLCQSLFTETLHYITHIG